MLNVSDTLNLNQGVISGHKDTAEQSSGVCQTEGLPQRISVLINLTSKCHCLIYGKDPEDLSVFSILVKFTVSSGTEHTISTEV